MKMLFSQNQKGNAILISLGMTSFLFVVAAGAGSMIDASLRQSPKVVNSGKAFYAAEGAVESALFEAGGRASGYETSGSTIDMELLNKTKANWSASSREDFERDRNEGNANDRTVFIPPRKKSQSGTSENAIIGLEENWKKVRFGQAYSFDLFVDNSTKTMRMPVGSGGGMQTYDCRNNNGSPKSFLVPDQVVCSSKTFNLLNDDCDYITIPESCSDENCEVYKVFSCIGSSSASNLHSGGVQNCSDTPGQVQGSHGICSTETNSIFGEGEDSNDDLEDIFIDVYIPAEEPAEANLIPVLSWSLGAKTYDITTNKEDVLELKSITCDDNGEADIGILCAKHFSESADDYPLTALQRFSDTNHGVWVRLHNPTGIMKIKNSFVPVKMLDYAHKNISYNNGDFYTFPLYFPKLTLQMGKKQKWAVGNDEKTLSEAYIRIGFRYKPNTNPSIISNFPLPSDKTTIQATGSADGFEQKISVEIRPQELAPMFEYAVFQP